MSEYSSRATDDREVLPHGEFDHDGRLKIVIAGLDQNIRSHAIEAANDRINEKIGSGSGGFGRFLKGIWHTDLSEVKAGVKDVRGNLKGDLKTLGRGLRYGSLGREFYLAKYTQEAEHEIIDEGNLLQHEGMSAEDYRIATTLRFAHEYDEMIHDGENRHNVIDQNEDGSVNPEGSQLKEKIFELIGDYSAGKFSSDDDFHEAKKRMITELVKKGLTEDHIGEGLLYTDNLLQIAQNVKAMVTHREAMGEDVDINDIFANADIVLGNAKLGARTELELGHVERITKKLEGKTFLNDSTLTTAVSVGYSVLDWAAKKVVSTAGRFLVIGAGSGVLASLREKRVLKEERVQHTRNVAVGGSTENLTGRREALEQARYESKTAVELTSQIGDLYSDEGELQIPDRSSFDDALAALAEAEARIGLSDRMKIDLVSFSSVGDVEKERVNLDLALAKAKCDVRRFISSAADDELSNYGISPSDIPDIRSGTIDGLDFVLDQRIDASEGLLLNGSEDYEGIKQKDRIYRKLRAKRMAGAFVKGTLLGMAIGVTAQEAMAFAYDGQQGYIESMVGIKDHDATRQTMLEGFFHEPGQSFEMSGQLGHPVELGKYTKLNLPEEFHTTQTGNSLTINGPEGMHLSGVTLTADGHLTPDATTRLQGAGFNIAHSGGVATEVGTPKPVDVNAHQLVEHHKGLSTKVKRDFWYDDGTPKTANGSELGLQDVKMDHNGNYVVSISGMDQHATTSSNGSAINWKDAAAKGHIQVAISASEGTQAEVFMIKVDAHGNALIPKGNFESKFFSHSDGKAEFNGKYLEAVEVAGKDHNGITHIRPLATEIGTGKDTFKDSITPKPTHHNTTAYTLHYTPPLKDMKVSVPPVIPIYSRNGIGTVERAQKRTDTVPVPGGYGMYGETSGSGYGEMSPEEMHKVWEQERSPRLKNDPDHVLNVQEELTWYFDEREGNMDSGYVQELDRRIADDATLDSIGSDIELIVNIPVAAAYEKDNIYHTLSLYAKQDDESLSKTRIVLSLNWKEGSNVADVEATRAEIMRAKHDFPSLNIATFDEIWSQDFVASRNGKIYGRVVKSLYDTSMRAVEKANKRNLAKADPLIVTNDADAADISKNYLAQLIKAKADFPEADVFSAKIHWGTESFKDYPGFGIVSSFLSLVEDRYRDSYRNKPGGGSWGANSAFRTSALAATGGANGNRGEGVDGEMGRRIYRARINHTRVGRRRSLEPVTGAWIDTAPERQLEAYKKNVLLTDSWADFSAGGYQPRPDLAVGSDKEDVSTDFDQIKSRIEHQIGGMLSSNWDIGGRDEELIEAALENIFFKPDGKKLWNIRGTGDNMSFKFTSDGDVELKAVLGTIHESVKEGLSMLDEVYDSSRAAGA
jgi:hypothetical protein